MGQAACASAWMADETATTPGERLVDPAITPEHRTYVLLMHLSLIATHFVGITLVLAPLIMWQIKKTESAYIDDQGREIVNFQISLLIYGLLITGLAIISCGIGAIVFAPLYIFAVVAMILGAIAANKGEYFRYPATIRMI